MKLLEPQIPHAQKLLKSIQSRGFAKDLSVMGTGKTYVACSIANELGLPVVVICPRNAKNNWRKVLDNFKIRDYNLINYETLIRGNSPYLKYDLKKFHRTSDWWKSEGVILKFKKNSFIIVDEEHRCKGQKSLSSDLLLALKNKQKKNHYKLLGCSATAATSVWDMRAWGYSSDLHQGYNYKSWCKNHGVRYNAYGSIDWDADQADARDGLFRIHDKIFNEDATAGRLKREDFGDLFPDNILHSKVFDIGTNADKLTDVYNTMQSEISALDDRSASYKNHIFAIMIKARRKAELLKVPAMVEWITDIYEEGSNPVVFCNFKDSIDAILSRLTEKKLRDTTSLLVGGQSEQLNASELALFQENKKRIFIANLQAGNASIGLHDITGDYPRCSLINPSWKALDFYQASGRIPRAEGKTKCLQYFMYANVGIEESMARRLNDKLNNLETLNDGDVAYDIALMS